jgi:murein DD-endopeptidase MepM/ murein hydrolase activator NlpD
VKQRAACLLLAALALSAPALADDVHQKKQRVDAKISSLHEKIAAAQQREAKLRAQISAFTADIRSLERQVGDVSAKLDVLQRDLALHQARLDKLHALYQLQTKKYRFEKQQYAAALQRLNRRLVDIYVSNDPTALDVILAARSFEATIDQLDYLNAIASQDKQIAADVAAAKRQARIQQLRTKSAQYRVRSEVQVVAVRTYQVGAIKAQLLGRQGRLSSAQQRQRAALVDVRESEQEFVAEANAYRAVSQNLAAQIRAAEARRTASPPATTGDGTSPAAPAPSSSGLIWPVQGAITSPFGMRWGSLHPGLDIGAGYGTPIHAAASGTVIVAGPNGGYGNLVVIDDGNHLATAYAHQQQIAVLVGQQVNQGDVIGYVGSTGFSTGPHLHFEVRVNGNPVDPLGYL